MLLHPISIGKKKQPATIVLCRKFSPITIVPSKLRVSSILLPNSVREARDNGTIEAEWDLETVDEQFFPVHLVMASFEVFYELVISFLWLAAQCRWVNWELLRWFRSDCTRNGNATVMKSVFRLLTVKLSNLMKKLGVSRFFGAFMKSFVLHTLWVKSWQFRTWRKIKNLKSYQTWNFLANRTSVCRFFWSFDEMDSVECLAWSFRF